MFHYIGMHHVDAGDRTRELLVQVLCFFYSNCFLSLELVPFLWILKMEQ